MNDRIKRPRQYSLAKLKEIQYRQRLEKRIREANEKEKQLKDKGELA